MNKRVLILLIAAVVLLGGAVWAGAKLAGGDKLSPYSAVYLETGDIYFGEYSRFPSPHLTNVWYLERGENSQVGFIPFKNVFWSPADEISLNSKKIVLVARIKAESQLAKAMSGQGTPAQGNNDPNGGGTNQPQPQSSSSGIEPTQLPE